VLRSIPAGVVVTVVLLSGAGAGAGAGTAHRVVALHVPGGAPWPEGAATILTFQGETDAEIVAHGVPAGRRAFAYGVWLTGPVASHFIGFTPTARRHQALRVLAPLPAHWRRYRTLELTRERTSSPEGPGVVVLKGPLHR
jgi:hypothetical protein